MTVSLLEREPELGAIERVLGRAAQGRGGALVVTGPAGIGKTALLARAGAMAEAAGLRVLTARCALPERALRWSGARQLTHGISDVLTCPALLTVDDLEWADSQSLGWLALVARRSQGAPGGRIGAAPAGG